MHEGIAPGKQDGMSSAANHGDVRASAGWCASPTAGRAGPDLHQKSPHSSSSGIVPTGSQPKDCKNKQTLRAGLSGKSLACSSAARPGLLPSHHAQSQLWPCPLSPGAHVRISHVAQLFAHSFAAVLIPVTVGIIY